MNIAHFYIIRLLYTITCFTCAGVGGRVKGSDGGGGAGRLEGEGGAGVGVGGGVKANDGGGGAGRRSVIH